MATVNFSDLARGSVRKAVLTSVSDITDWMSVNGPCNIVVSGGSAFTVEIERALEADNSDTVIVATQDAIQRGAYYDFVGPGAIRVRLTAVTAGPVTVHVSV